MAAFVPVEMTNGEQVEVANSRAEQSALLWRGWRPTGNPAFDVEQVSVYPVVEGLPVTMFGASYEGADLTNNPGTRYPGRAARRLGFVLTNRAVSGYEMADMAHLMIQAASTSRFVPGTKGIIFLAGLMNDVLREPALATRKATFKESLKACIWRAFCASVIQAGDAGVTATAGWTQQNLATTAGFNMQFKSTTTANETLTIPTVATRDLVVFNYALATEKVSGGGGTVYAGRGPQFSVAVDGTTVADHVTPYSATVTGSPRAWTATPLATPLLGLTNATHSLVFTNHQDAGGGTRLQTFDSVGIIDRTNIPQVVISKGITFDPARLPTVVGMGANAAVALFRTYVDEAVAEVIAAAPWAADAITVYDPVTWGWDATTMVSTADNIHATDLGHHVMGSALADTIATLPWRFGMNK